MVSPRHLDGRLAICTWVLPMLYNTTYDKSVYVPTGHKTHTGHNTKQIPTKTKYPKKLEMTSETTYLPLQSVHVSVTPSCSVYDFDEPSGQGSFHLLWKPCNKSKCPTKGSLLQKCIVQTLFKPFLRVSYLFLAFFINDLDSRSFRRGHLLIL